MEPDARIAHEGRQPYTAILGPPESPKNFVELNGDYVGVGFLDERRREFLSYQFQERRPGKLFLTMATHRDFEDGSDEVSSATTYYFQEDDSVTIERTDTRARTRLRSESKADIRGNWEDYPEFGRYEGVARAERDLGGGDP